MVYIDSNIFILAIINNESIGEKARKFLRNVQEGKEAASTSTLTFDEVVWKVLQTRGFDNAMIVANDLLEMQNLVFLDVNTSVLLKSYRLMKSYNLYPRDSIHASCALNNNIFTIISEDKDFDRIKELRRKGISQLKL